MTAEQRHNAALQKEAQHIWGKAAPYYGANPNSKAPRMWVAPSLSGQEAESVTAGEDGAKRTGVKFSPKLAEALLNGGSLANTAKETVLHEWAHQYQNPRPITPQNDWAVEGGAETFARQTAPRVYGELGVPYHNPQYNGYQNFSQRVRAERGNRWIDRGQFKPVFSEESAQNEPRAYTRNRKWAKSSETNYQTQLTPLQEQHFRQWLRNTGNPGEFRPDAKRVPYDMRGYWLHLAESGKLGQAGAMRGREIHFPDAWKTPYDPSFSKWSKYARSGTPFVWRPGNRLVNRNTGRVVFAEH